MPGLNDNGYFLNSRTVLYTAPVDTAQPDASVLDSPPVAWTILGHVGDETGDGNASFTREGGDVTTKGSITKKAIRTVVDPVFSGIDVDVTQLTRIPLQLYHGTAGGTNPTAMQIDGNSEGTATELAMLVVWEDGTKRVGLYAPRASWTGRDNIDTDSIEDAVRIPLHASFLDSATINASNGKPLRYTWISPTLLVLS
jgi:hypothetical protein